MVKWDLNGVLNRVLKRGTSIQITLLMAFCFTLISVANLFAEKSDDKIKLYNWRTESSLLSAQSAIVDKSGNIWVATTGGIYTYSTFNNETKSYRNISDLTSSSFNLIKIDESDNSVYAYSVDGTVEIYDKNSDSWEHITDIKNSNFTNKTIRDALIQGNNIYMVGGFGMSRFEKQDRVFKEEARRYGKFQLNSDTKKIIAWDNKLWVATVEGVASIPISKAISIASNWENYSIFNQSVIDLVVNGNQLYAATESGVYKLNTNTNKFDTVLTNSGEIKQLITAGTELYISTKINNQNVVIDLNRTRVLEKFSSQKIMDIVFLNSSDLKNEFLVQTALNFLVLYSDAPSQVISVDKQSLVQVKEKKLTPNSPSVNSYEDIKVFYGDKTGVQETWIATGAENGNGVMCFRNGIWYNITPSSFKGFSKYVHKVNVNKKGDVFCSTFGDGLFILKRIGEFSEEDLSKTFQVVSVQPDNSPIVGYRGGGGYPIVGDVKFDKEDNAYIVNWGEPSAEGPLFIKMDNEGNFTPYYNCFSKKDRFYYNLLIDENNTKWVSSSFAKMNNFGGTVNTGLMYFNENRQTSANIDVCGRINTSNFPNIRSNTQTAIKQDKTGVIWVGTNLGLVALFNPGAVFFNSPNFALKEVLPLNDVEILDIYVDAVNNKWIASAKGIFVINSDGTELLLTINKDNSPMTTNTVFSINGNEQTGEVYIGTDDGMYTVNTYAEKPLNEYQIKLSPQPFNPSVSDEITIAGLADNSEIKIMTLSGAVIKTLYSKSQKVFWDGRNESQQRVESGVYLLSISSASSEKNGVCKMMVLWD